MRVRTSLIGIALLVVLVALGLNAPARAQVVGGGLLLNGSFEGEYATLEGFPNTNIAPNWLPWWVGQRNDEAPWSNQRPEFRATDERIRSGEKAQRYYTDLATHQAGVLQRVSGVEQGQVLEFQVWARTWSSNHDHPCCSLESGLVSLRAGIDPTGGANPYASTVVWSEPVRTDDTWSPLSVRATAQGEGVTVFVFSAPKYPVLHNEVYLDDARLVMVGQEVGPTPIPELTATPSPTPTPLPPEYVPEPEALEDPYAVSEPFPLENEVVSGPLVYSIQPGDTLASIAEQFDVDVAELADANGLTEGDTIYVAGQLVIPNLTFVAPETVARYTMQPGDTLGEIAFAFDTTIYTLAQLNGIVSYEQVEAGTEILVPIDAGSGALPGGLTSHTVEPGESLTRIGLRYNTPSQAIASANHLGNAAFVYPGQTLIIP